MSFISILDKIGHDIASVFTKAAPIVNELQAIATPFENIYAPGLSQLVNLGLTSIENAQALAIAAGQGDGSGQQKLALVIAALAQQAAPVLQSLGVNPATVTSTQYTNFINALVAAAHVFEVPVVATAPTSTAPTAAALNAVSPAPVTGAVVPKS